MATKRKSISKKTRFEVFKRDSFKCQYCGKCAPEAILHVDHINPVSKGGDNDILNLLTACEDCNGGKSDRLLSDDSVMAKQRAQLEELNERREQLEMMLKWRDGMRELGDKALNIAIEAWEKENNPFNLTELGTRDLKKIVREFPLQIVLDAIEISSERYLQRDKDGKLESSSIVIAFEKLGGVCRNLMRPDEDKRLYYIRGICRNRFTHCNEIRCIQLLRDASKAGCDVCEMENIAKAARNWSEWTNEMYHLIETQEA